MRSATCFWVISQLSILSTMIIERQHINPRDFFRTDHASGAAAFSDGQSQTLFNGLNAAPGSALESLYQLA